MSESPDPKPSSQEVPDSELHLEQFESAPDEHGLSLDELSQTFADLISQGDDPYVATPPVDPATAALADEIAAAQPTDEAEVADEPPLGEEFDDCDVTPRSILEALMFVGHPENVPLTSTQVAGMMRGVRASEIHDLIEELNEAYAKDGSAFEIKAIGGGYVMKIRPEYEPLRNKFYGKIREARLSQAAVDVLAVVAYHQPITKEEVDKLRGKPSGGLLRQLVRREILRLERTQEKPRVTRYFTTDRFLDLFGMENVGELPQSQELDRTL